MILRPNGALGLSRVSTLGNHPNKWFALKGREIRAALCAYSPGAFPLLFCFRTLHLSPFQGARRGTVVPAVETPD
jgi:hypothetical protein